MEEFENEMYFENYTDTDSDTFFDDTFDTNEIFYNLNNLRENIELNQIITNYINSIDIEQNYFMNIYEDLEDVKVTLSEEEFNIINKKRIIDEKNKETVCCAICLENIIKYDNLTILKCDHIYHKDCIKTWLLNQSTKCPICRLELRNC